MENPETPSAPVAAEGSHVLPEGYDPNESIGYLLKRVHQSIQREVDNLMTPLDLTAMQWGPLMLLAMKRGETAGELARCACTDTGAMTRMLDRLESKDLIRRVRSVADRRVIKIELTEEGRRVTKQIPDKLVAAVERHTKGIAEADLELVRQTLRRMLANGDSPS
ncbi:MarR family transcriptional regulator [Pigmentiphaga soli]|uniref:MarR family transcriptional regulator n=1 Tax=Pigmentiphaga soli TaxID=1007095 RepID=A0ABP8GZJ1_9BURK